MLVYLEAQRTSVNAAFDAVPPEMRDLAPGPGRWSAANILEHLAMVKTRIAKLLSHKIEMSRAAGIGKETSTDPVLPTIDVANVFDRTTRVNAPEAVIPNGMDSVSAWKALEEASHAMHDMVVSGEGLALGDILHPHPRFGPMSVYQWVAFIGAHEGRHAAQIREINDSSSQH